MSEAYDKFDYPSYWKGREYEHKSELIVLNEFLRKIHKIKKVLDIGCGFGRLTPTYIHRAEKAILTDPSIKILKLAKQRLSSPKVTFIKSRLENLDKKLKKSSVDLVILVRVLHHIENPKLAFEKINFLLKDGGYFILEFANKIHFKSTLLEFIRGNFTFLMDIFPKELNPKKSKRIKLPFTNYHPDFIKNLLEKTGFKIIEVRSVSNVRSPFIKKILTEEMLIFFEKHLQKILAKIFFGPSIFILAKKVKS